MREAPGRKQLQSAAHRAICQALIDSTRRAAMHSSRFTAASESKLESELHNSCIGRFHSLTEQRAVEIALYRCGSKKLRVIERVKALDAQLQKLGFRDIEILEQGNIEIQRARPMEGAARCVSKGAQGG